MKYDNDQQVIEIPVNVSRNGDDLIIEIDESFCDDDGKDQSSTRRDED